MSAHNAVSKVLTSCIFYLFCDLYQVPLGFSSPGVAARSGLMRIPLLWRGSLRAVRAWPSRLTGVVEPATTGAGSVMGVGSPSGATGPAQTMLYI
jgi:hypothetical protein